MSEDSGRILVVDDNWENRDMLSRRLTRKGYTVAVAAEGRAALGHIGSEAVDLVLLDVMMPEMDGFQVLVELRRTRDLADLPVIMATARDRSEDVVQALELGANDYVTKPLDFPVVLARVRTQLALRRARRALEQANARMRRDLEAGARIQRALIPQRSPAAEGVEVAWAFEPCAELGGDILDVFTLDDGGLGLYLLDVSGHGVPAALTSVTLSRLLSHMGSESLLFESGEADRAGAAAPAALAAALSRRFPFDPVTKQYFTLLYSLLDRGRRELRFVAAGHPGPVHVAAAGEARVLDSGGPAIGCLPDFVYPEGSVALARGDRLYFYSDGVIEAEAPGRELFGTGRLVDSLIAGRGLPLGDSLERLRADLRLWCQGDPDDDISLLALEITG